MAADGRRRPSNWHELVSRLLSLCRRAVRQSTLLLLWCHNSVHIAPLPPHRCSATPSYLEYVLQTCLLRTRRLALSRVFHHPQPTHRAACAAHHLLSTDLRAQMTISRAREEGRLTRLQRAKTRSIPHGQATLIPSIIGRTDRRQITPDSRQADVCTRPAGREA